MDRFTEIYGLISLFFTCLSKSSSCLFFFFFFPKLMCSHFFSINCSTKDNEKLCKHFAEIALSFSCVLLSFLFFTPSSFRVFEFARVCVCAWFECCSFVADSWNDTNCYHCAPLSLWKLTTTTEKFTIHEVQILDSQYSLKATWRGGEMTLMNDEYKTVLPPPKKKTQF